MLFSMQSLPTSDPVTTTMLQAAAKGSQAVVQILVKQFVNVEDKVGMKGYGTAAIWLWAYELDWERDERMRIEIGRRVANMRSEMAVGRQNYYLW